MCLAFKIRRFTMVFFWFPSGNLISMRAEGQFSWLTVAGKQVKLNTLTMKTRKTKHCIRDENQDRIKQKTKQWIGLWSNVFNTDCQHVNSASQVFSPVEITLNFQFNCQCAFPLRTQQTPIYHNGPLFIPGKCSKCEPNDKISKKNKRWEKKLILKDPSFCFYFSFFAEPERVEMAKESCKR